MISGFALVASRSGDICFAVTLASDHAEVGVLLAVANTAVKGAFGITVAGHAHVRVSQILALFVIESFNASLASCSFGVVLTLVADAAGCLIVGCIDDWIKMTLVRVIVAITG